MTVPHRPVSAPSRWRPRSPSSVRARRVFARKLIGDLLRFPALADGVTLALMDIDPERLQTSAAMARRIAERLSRGRRRGGDRRPARRARRRRLRHRLLSGRRPASGDDGRLRRPQALRDPSDDRGHPRNRRDHARAADDPSTARHLPRHGGAVPRTPCFSSTSIRWRCCAGRSPSPARSAPSGCAIPSSTPPHSSAACSGSRRRSSTTSWPASTTSRSSCPSSAAASTPIYTRACAASSRPTGCHPRTRSGSRSCAASVTS